MAIYNIQGKIEFSEISALENQYLEFDFQHKGSGIYLLKVIAPQSVKVYRIIKY